MENMGSLRKAFLMKQAANATDKDGLTRAQLGILMAIAHDGPQSIKELAQHFMMSSSAATQMVHALVTAKLLTRAEDAYDRRRICVALTPEGKKRLAKAKAHHTAWFADLLSVLSDQELSQLQKIQQKIITHLHA